LYDDLLTKQYAPGGRGPDYYDCWGLCAEIAKRRGGVVPSFPAWIDYVARSLFFEDAAGQYFEQFDRPAPWRIVAYRVRAISNPSLFEYHIGTVLERSRRFIHARSTCGIAITRLSDYPEPAGFFDLCQTQ